jgi:outer membrane protein, multidrug efflux system
VARKLAFSFCLLCLPVASACAVGPDYQRPAVATPPQWRETPATDASLANIPWWELFNDPQLHQLIKVALHENRDLKIAIERIEEARATYGISKADLYPKLDARLNAGGLRTSSGSLTHTPEGDADNTKALFNADLALSWELDLFGRIRRANEAELALLLSTEEARRAVAITLVADVASAYMELRDFDRRLEIARGTLASRQEYVDLARLRFEGNVTHEVDLRQAEAEYHRIESFVYELEKLVSQKENELAFLIGHNPEATVRGRTLGEQPIPPEVPAGLPAALLERRPDVRKAEMDLWSSTARIGEATAMLYPSIKLTGSFGVASTDLGDLVDPGSISWNLFANLLQPIFNAGKNLARVEVTESRQRQAVYAYERTLLQALREVEDSLVGFHKAGAKRTSEAQRVTAERKVVELAELRYRGGVTTYLEVLDAQRSLFNAEIDEVSAASDHLTSLISLYKALGGGWPPDQQAANTPADGAKPKAAEPKPAEPKPVEPAQSSNDERRESGAAKGS